MKTKKNGKGEVKLWKWRKFSRIFVPKKGFSLLAMNRIEKKKGGVGGV